MFLKQYHLTNTRLLLVGENHLVKITN